MADFDALVLAMRAARTTEGIMAVYEPMFRLESWFLLSDPEDPSGPMQWRFEKGLEPSPCVLVYTDAERAKRQAAQVGATLGASIEVWSIAVPRALAWFRSGALGVSWACVNLAPGSANFPLYFHQIDELAIAFGVAEGPIEEDDAFFPADYKSFPFREGDLLASERTGGKFAISKILRVDKIDVRAGESIQIQGQPFTAPVDDFLLVISAALGAAEFDSLEQARAAAAANRWTLQVGHIPNRPPGAAAGKTLVGSAPVTEAELEGYRLWREAFDRGEAGIF